MLASLDMSDSFGLEERRRRFRWRRRRLLERPLPEPEGSF
jgi:hypothetical protein